MIEFKPEKLSIVNFRGIPSFDLDIVESTPTYLIGPNNAGKSTVLQAIAFAFKAGSFYKFVANEYDFYHKSNNEKENSFAIKIDFKSLGNLPSVHTVGQVKEVRSIQVKGHCYKTSGRIEYSHRLLDKNGDSIVLPTETKMSKKDVQNYEESGHGYKARSARLDDIRKYIPDVWLLTASNLEASLYSWKTGPLNKLANILSKKFFEEEWEFKFGDKKRLMPKGVKQAHNFFSAAIKEFPFWKENMKPALEKSLTTYLGKQTSIELNPLLQSIEDWLQQQLLLSFAAETGAVFTPLERMGDGFQSLVRLAALEVLAETDKVEKDNIVMLYEEPETYLHPHLKRKLRNIFDTLAEKGWHIFCATHAPEFISFERRQSISRIIRGKDAIKHGHILTGDIPNNLKLQEKIDEYGNHEIFFAQKIILCEGKDDYFAIKSYLEMSNIDVEAISLSILSCGGVENIPFFAEIAHKLKIPFCAVSDTDLNNSGLVKAKTKKARDKILSLKSPSDEMVEWDNNLEDCFMAPLVKQSNERKKVTPEWQRDSVFIESFNVIKTKYPAYNKACETIVKWLVAQPQESVNEDFG